jgi:hypothetical protein
MQWRAWCMGVWAAVAGGCATAPGPDSLALRTAGDTRLLDIYPGGGVVSADYQLKATPEGYWGTFGGGATVDLNAHGGRIVGVIGPGIVNMHLRIQGDAVRLQGLYGGALGGLSADRQAISAWLGLCYYDLHAVGNRFEGQRNCHRRRVQPATVELPPGFAALPPQRRAMLLALLLAT